MASDHESVVELKEVEPVGKAYDPTDQDVGKSIYISDLNNITKNTEGSQSLTSQLQMLTNEEEVARLKSELVYAETMKPQLKEENSRIIKECKSEIDMLNMKLRDKDILLTITQKELLRERERAEQYKLQLVQWEDQIAIYHREVQSMQQDILANLNELSKRKAREVIRAPPVPDQSTPLAPSTSCDTQAKRKSEVVDNSTPEVAVTPDQPKPSGTAGRCPKRARVD